MGDKKVLRIVLVEDEQPASRQLKRLLAEVLPNSEVVQVLDSVEEAVSYFKNEEDVDLIFLDIHLADGLSFDIFDQVNLPAPVIFTTAYDQYAIKAFKVHSIDYLLKPIEKDDLKGAIDKFFELRLESTSGNVDYGKLIQAMREAGNPFKKRFLVKPGGRLAFVNTEDVSYFFSEEGLYIFSSERWRAICD
jgi:two-component system response regulator LytT